MMSVFFYDYVLDDFVFVLHDVLWHQRFIWIYPITLLTTVLPFCIPNTVHCCDFHVVFTKPSLERVKIKHIPFMLYSFLHDLDKIYRIMYFF
jgi:hypothetical protein